LPEVGRDQSLIFLDELTKVEDVHKSLRST